MTSRNVSTNQDRDPRQPKRRSFHAEALPVGSYEVRVDLPGFAPYRQAGSRPDAWANHASGYRSFPASLSEKVTVNAATADVEPRQASVVSPRGPAKESRNFPVRSRNSLDFVLLAPGRFERPDGAARGGGTPLAGSGFTFGGLRARSNTISIDGLDNNDEYTGSGRTELSPEIVQEFQVVKNGLSAESGGASGGSINVITRSGTNTIHGDAFIFAQDAALNARDPFENEPGKPSFRRYRAGFALGGPDRQGSDVLLRGDRTGTQSRAERFGYRSRRRIVYQFFLSATGAFPRLATREITTNFFPHPRAETEAAGKLDHQLTRNTSLMLRYAFTNNREAGDAFNTSGLADISARGSSFIADNALSGSLTTVFGSERGWRSALPGRDAPRRACARVMPLVRKSTSRDLWTLDGPTPG